MAVCNVCHVEKPISEYYKDVTRAGGIRYDCKACCIERSKKNAAKYKQTEKGRKKINNLKKGWAKRARDQLRDYYIRKKLSDGTCLEPATFPAELVDAKRAYMQINRHIKENRK